MKIAVASEHRGFRAKDSILSPVERDSGHEASGLWTAQPRDVQTIPAFAAKSRSRCGAVAKSTAPILIGGTGIGR